MPLDVLRGLALFGVLIVNLLTLFRVSLASHIASTDVAGKPDEVVLALVSAVIEFKAFTLFSFLFGAGIGVQADRLSGHGSAAAFLLRRFAVLLLIGAVHLLLIWNGDILALYAVCGLLAIPFLRLPVSAIAATGAALIVASGFGSIPVVFPGTEALKAHAAEATKVYSQGRFAQIAYFRWYETKILIVPLLIMSLPRTLGVILLGISAWRSRLLTDRRKEWLSILVGFGAVALAGAMLHVDVAAQISLAFAYAAAILLWLPHAPLFAAAGQMALTNYLTQSVICTMIFYGYGLGWFGHLRVLPAAALGSAIYVLQLLWSRWWLGRFRFGPVEWLWRSMTYGHIQPFRRSVQR